MKVSKQSQILPIAMAVVSLLGLSNSAYCDGVGAGGGGETPSQRFVNLMGTVPNAIIVKGIDKFPEINFAELVKKIKKSPLKVEICPDESKFFVNGAPKEAINHVDANLIQILPQGWANKTEEEKLALAAHEVFSLMRLESNNDYHISNRLLGGLSLDVIQIATDPTRYGNGELRKEDLYNEGAIIIRTIPDYPNLRLFQFCKNVQEISSCTLIGNRLYDVQELEQLQKTKETELRLAQRQLTYAKWKERAILYLPAIAVSTVVTLAFCKFNKGKNPSYLVSNGYYFTEGVMIFSSGAIVAAISGGIYEDATHGSYQLGELDNRLADAKTQASVAYRKAYRGGSARITQNIPLEQYAKAMSDAFNSLD